MKKWMLTMLVGFALLALQPLAHAQVLSSAHSIYFGSGSSALSADNKAFLDQVATRIKDKSSLQDVVVYGYASKDGGVAYNLNLSMKRIDVVYDYLKAAGVPENKLIKKVPRGEEESRSKWYKGEPEPEGAKARFVELIITPKIDAVDPAGAVQAPADDAKSEPAEN